MQAEVLGARGRSRFSHRAGWGEPWIFWCTILVTAYLVVLPLAALTVGSLLDGPPGQARGFTLASYVEAYGRGSIYGALCNSVLYATGSSTLAFVFGTFLAWVTQRTNTPLRQLFFVAALFPLFVPSVLFVIGWILLLSPQVGVLNRLASSLLSVGDPLVDVYSMGGMIWVGGVLETSLAFLWLWPVFRAMDPALEEASLVSGASTFKTLTHVTLRLSTPGLLAAWLIVFVRQLESFAIPGLLGMPKGIHVLATEIYLATTRMPRNVNLAATHAISLIAVTLFGVWLYRRATAASERYVTVTGRGYRPRILDLKGWRWLTCALAGCLLLLMVGLPFLVLVFNSFLPYLHAPTLGSFRLLTFKNFVELQHYQVAFRAFKNSMLLGVLSGVCVMLLSTVAAWIVVRSRLRYRGAVDLLGSIPVAIPGIVVGIATLWVYLLLPLPVYGTLWILLIAYVMRFLPHGMRIGYTAFGQISRELEEASYVAGGSWSGTFREISLPLLAPAILAGGLFVMLNAVRELPASLLLTHFGTEVLSVAVWDLWEGGYGGRVAAYGVVITVVLSVLSLAVQRLGVRFGVRG